MYWKYFCVLLYGDIEIERFIQIPILLNFNIVCFLFLLPRPIICMVLYNSKNDFNLFQVARIEQRIIRVFYPAENIMHG